MLPALGGVSSCAEAYETTLSGLNEGSFEGLAREVELLHDFAVHLDPALGDHPPRVARGADPEMLDEKRRQMHLGVGRQRCLRNVVGRLLLHGPRA